MSLQRIFESARKMGIPVIITDPAGREPMVVLPLEHFEALAGGTEENRPNKPEMAPKAQDFKPLTQPEPILEPDLEKPLDLPENPQEIALEERFYLEPVEDETAV